VIIRNIVKLIKSPVPGSFHSTRHFRLANINILYHLSVIKSEYIHNIQYKPYAHHNIGTLFLQPILIQVYITILAAWLYLALNDFQMACIANVKKTIFSLT